MKANRKFIEDKEAVSAVIGVILMVAITVAIAATVYVYVSGMMGSPSSEAESASVVCRAENKFIKITLTTGGNNMPSNGYDLNATIKVRTNGTLPATSTFTDDYFDVGESLYISADAVSGEPTVLSDSPSGKIQLDPADYSVTITISETVIYDDEVRIV
jgi:archaeal type IV pilus assembly protein PilA